MVTVMPHVEFQFDFGSPNAYLSHLVIPEIEQRTGVKFDYVPVLLQRLVTALCHTGRANDAIARADKALQRFPSFTDMVYSQALAALALGREDDAISYWQRCIEMGDAPAHLGAAVGGGTYRPRVALADLPERRAAEPDLQVLDVRERSEWDAGHIPGSLHVELGSVGAAGIAASGPLTLMCGPGERAMTAASLLAAAGHHDLRVVVGGADDWATASGRPLTTGR